MRGRQANEGNCGAVRQACGERTCLVDTDRRGQSGFEIDSGDQADGGLIHLIIDITTTASRITFGLNVASTAADSQPCQQGRGCRAPQRLKGPTGWC